MLRCYRLLPAYSNASRRLYSTSDNKKFNVVSFLSRVEKLYDNDSGRNRLKTSTLSMEPKEPKEPNANRESRNNGNKNSRKRNRNGMQAGDSWNRRVSNLTNRQRNKPTVENGQSSGSANKYINSRRDANSKWSRHDADIEMAISTNQEHLDLHISPAKSSPSNFSSQQKNTRGPLFRKDGTRGRRARNADISPVKRMINASSKFKRNTYRRRAGVVEKKEVSNGLSAKEALIELKNLANNNNGFVRIEGLNIADMISRLPNSAITYNTRVLSAVHNIKISGKEQSESNIENIVEQIVMGIDESTISSDSDELNSLALVNALNANSSLSKKSRLLVSDAVNGKRPLSELRSQL